MADQKLTDLTEVSVPALDDLLYTVDVSDTSGGAAGTSKKLTQTRQLGLLNQVCQGRLTLVSGSPIADASAATSIYFTPFNGNCVSLYDGTRWRMYAFTELTLALGTLTNAKNYDVFLYDNAGTLTLESLVWTNDTTRATALTTQDGVYVKTGATTRRYLGTFRTTSTTTTEDSVGGSTTQVGGKRFLWNLYNQVLRPIRVIDTTDSWSYTTDTWRVSDGATAPLNCVEYVNGITGTGIHASVRAVAYLVSNTTRPARSGVGLDGTTPAGLRQASYNGTASGNEQTLNGDYTFTSAVGYHYLAWLERGADSTCTWLGDNGADGTQCGLEAGVMG